MSDNKLLAENTIRRFMKLANVQAMTDNFISENYEEEINEEEEFELEENLEDIEEQDEPEDEPMELDAEMGELDDDAPEPDMGEEPEMGAADMSLTEEEARLLIDLGERLSAAMDEGAEEGEEPEQELGDAPETDIEDTEDMEGMEDGEEPPGGRYQMEEEVDQEELVNEVLKRVTKRLVAAKLQKRK